MVAQATPIMHATPQPVKPRVPSTVAPLGFAWRPLRVVPAVHRDHYWVASAHTPGQWYQVYLAILDAAHAHCNCPQATYRLNRPESPLCKHSEKVVEHILDEPAPLSEPEPAAAPETGGSVMDVLRRRREIHAAVAEDRALPFRRPAAPVCCELCDQPASKMYPHKRRCAFHGFQDLF